MWTATIESVTPLARARGIQVIVRFSEGVTETDHAEALQFSGPDWRKDLEGAVKNRLVELSAMATVEADAVKDVLGKVYSLDESGEAKPNA